MTGCLWILLFLAATLPHKVHSAGDISTYSAVVVEYSPTIDPSVEAGDNILNNVHNYIQAITNASKEYQADIIVFPEDGLTGYSNQEDFLHVPDPANKLVPCAKEIQFEAPLVQLSCAARATGTYMVVNLGEKYYDYGQQKLLYHNTDVVFDRQGAVIARYRKIHLFGEKGKQPPTEKEFAYFDTDFGVRFGIYTCFDIIFKDPGIESAKKYNISHFIFPTAWFSEMPFLTAIQEQWYWSYTQNAALMAAGYNKPDVGSSGSGIYLGRAGPAVYTMSETRRSFMLHAQVPKDIHSQGSTELSKSTRELKSIPKKITVVDKENYLNVSKLNLKRHSMELFASTTVSIPEGTQEHFNGTHLLVIFHIQEILCQNNLCCNFSLNLTKVYSKENKNITRGDDYSQLHFRMIAFDGVRTYGHYATGGVQTCGIIPCVREDLKSCGLRADDPSVEINSLHGYNQLAIIFETVEIVAMFSNNDSFVGPNVLLGGEDDNFGSLMDSEGFIFTTSNETEYTVVKSLQTTRPVHNLVTMSLYGRVFSRDGEPYTGSPGESSYLQSNTLLFLLMLLLPLNILLI